MSGRVSVGTRVRIRLHGRRVAGWVVAEGGTAPEGVAIQPLLRVSGPGPAPEVIALARWAAWRWAGSVVSLLRSASPTSALVEPGPSVADPGPPGVVIGGPEVELATEGLDMGRAVVRVPPAVDAFGVVAAAAARGRVLVIAPTTVDAVGVAARLRRSGRSVALLPTDWGLAAAGGVDVVGTRTAAWGPARGLTSVVVLDAHDESLQQEQAPTWNAWQVAAERAGQAGVACLLVSPCPSLEMLAWGRLLRPPRQVERTGWAPLEVVDLRGVDPRLGRYPSRLVSLVRSDARVAVILNRKGRARLLACAMCGELAQCEVCGAAVEADGEELRCRRCGTARPMICAACGSQRMKVLRPGVSRVGEELAALAGEPVGSLTAESDEVPATRLVVGTEAALYRLDAVDAVVFLEFDHELLAPRYRAAEEALALLARASRLVGGRGRGGHVLAHTRVPDHEVFAAAVAGDPDLVVTVERARRRELAMPPERAVALVSGPAAGAYVDGLKTIRGLEVLGPDGDRWLVRAADHAVLCDGLAAVPRPPGRLRVAVDPLRA